MDPLTHALVGAVVTRTVVADRGDAGPGARTLLLAGALGALLPDVDRVIQSAADPLLRIEFHRHFTHALVFIPIGGIVAMLPWMLGQGMRPHWRVLLGAAMLGYASHGLLDASTTYGTLLFWPFSDRRVAWNWISIVDPLFTGMLLLGLARSAADPSVIGDARYSLSPHRFEPVWGIRFTPGLEPPIQWVDHSRGRRVDLRVWSDEVRGTDPAFRTVQRSEASSTGRPVR